MEFLMHSLSGFREEFFVKFMDEYLMETFGFFYALFRKISKQSLKGFLWIFFQWILKFFFHILFQNKSSDDSHGFFLQGYLCINFSTNSYNFFWDFFDLNYPKYASIYYARNFFTDFFKTPKSYSQVFFRCNIFLQILQILIKFFSRDSLNNFQGSPTIALLVMFLEKFVP